MRNYQSVLILKPDLDEGHVDQAFEKISSLIKKYSGEVIKLDKWGKKRLAYKVKKNKFGYYLNIYHTCDPAQLSELEKEFKLFDQIIKFLVIRLEDKDLERVMAKAAEAAEAAETEAQAGDDADKPKEAAPAEASKS